MSAGRSHPPKPKRSRRRVGPASSSLYCVPKISLQRADRLFQAAPGSKASGQSEADRTQHFEGQGVPANVVIPDLAVTLGPLKLNNPVLTASGTFGFGAEWADFYDLSRLGGIMV